MGENTASLIGVYSQNIKGTPASQQKTNNLILKWAKNLNKHLSKEDL